MNQAHPGMFVQCCVNAGAPSSVSERALCLVNLLVQQGHSLPFNHAFNSAALISLVLKELTMEGFIKKERGSKHASMKIQCTVA
jgi:hypothetical protein